MTFLYPLSIVRGDNHTVIAFWSELSSSRASEGYCLRSDSPGLLDAFDDVRRATASTDTYSNILRFQNCLDLTGEDFVETDVVTYRC